jgi:glycosyltransferase involved in cell wall biosynthesis
MRRRKICFVLPSLAGGGAERAAVQILNGLDASKWDRSMYLFRREGPYLGEVASGIELHSGAGGSRASRWLELRRFIAATNPDLVVAFLSYFSVLSAVRAAMTGARVIFNQQTPMSAFLEDADYEWRRPVQKRGLAAATRAGYNAVDLIVTSSQGVARDLTAAFGVDPARVRVVGNPVDVDAVRAASAEPLDPAHAERWQRPVIVAAGRLADAKNYPLLIDALALLRQRVPAMLFVLGEGERGADLRRYAAERGLAEAIVWCGFQSNPWKFMARADVFALTSRYEGFGNVLVEAMASGTPVVATRSPGTESIIRDGVDGVLTLHTAEAVAASLSKVLANAGERDRLAAAARESARGFSTPVIAREYDAVFTEALAR